MKGVDAKQHFAEQVNERRDRDNGPSKDANRFTYNNVARFREKISAVRRRAGYLQKDLAAALGLDSHMLSHKLHGSDGALLSHQEVKQIVKTLAAWDAITTRDEAIELLALMQLKPQSFSAQEWNGSPLDRLEAASHHRTAPKAAAESPLPSLTAPSLLIVGDST